MKNDILIDLKDIVIVSVPITLHELMSQSLTSCLHLESSEKGIPQGAVQELAVINKSQTKILLIRDFDDPAKARNIEGIIEKDAFGGILSKHLNFEKASNSMERMEFIGKKILQAEVGNYFFNATTDEVANGIKLKVLARRNKDFISDQLFDYYDKMEKEAQEKRKQKLLQDSKEKYMEF